MPRFSSEYIRIDDCRAQGTHMQSMDDDAYCNLCGEQDPDVETCIAEGTHLLTTDTGGFCVICHNS